MKQVLRLVAITLVATLFSVSPAEALFGSECKKPKAAYAQYLSVSKSLQKQEARAIEIEAQEYLRCLKNPKAFFLKKRITDKNYSCGTWRLLDRIPVTPREKTSLKEYKNAMLIVTSYKKCFDPSVYIEAAQWLKANPK
jgi:hypothetical protein